MKFVEFITELLGADDIGIANEQFTSKFRLSAYSFPFYIVIIIYHQI